MNLEIFEQARPREAAPLAVNRLMPTLSDMHAHQTKTTGNARNRELALFSGGFSFANAPDIYGDKKNILAQNFQLPMPYELEPGMNRVASDGLATVGKLAIDRVNEERAINEVNKISTKNWTEAYGAFPELKSHFSEKQATSLMKAIIANEAEHYDAGDLGQDVLLRSGLPVKQGWTMGLTQLSFKAVEEEANEFPHQLSGLKHSPREALLSYEKAPLLVAATLAHYIKQFSKYGYPINQETLGYAYNADLYATADHKDIMPTMERLQTSEHAANIRRWLTTFSD